MKRLNRNSTLDVMRGIGILLVVLYHAIVKNDPNIVASYSNGLFNVISSFFMPMFFAISGYLVYNKVGNLEWVKKHTIKWLIPIVIFILFYWGYNQLFPNLMYFFGLDKLDFVTYLMRMIAYGFGGSVLWFIWSFIVCYYLGYILEQNRLKFTKIPFIIMLILFITIINVIPFSNFGYFSVKWYGIFFFIGYAVNHYKVKISSWALIPSLILFPISIIGFDWLKHYQDAQWGNYGVTSLIPSILSGHAWLVGLIFMMAILGIIFVYAVAVIIKWQPLANILSYLGRNSIGIYLLHILFIGITKNYWISALLAAIISVMLYELLKRNKFVNWVLFGGDIPMKFEKLGGWYGKEKV